MRTTYITTTQRGVPYILLSSQLLTSYGLNEIAFPNKLEIATRQENIMREMLTPEEKEATKTPMVATIPTEMFEFWTKGGYQVRIPDGSKEAIVRESIGNFSKERELPVYNPFKEDLKNISQQGKLSQQYKVHINPDHVLIGKVRSSRWRKEYSCGCTGAYWWS
jgi:hypothetical protein